MTRSPEQDSLDIFDDVHEVSQQRPLVAGAAAVVGLVLLSVGGVVALVILLLRVVGPWLLHLIGELTSNMLLI